MQNLVILQRYATHGDTDRQWGNETTQGLAAAFKEQFPNHNVCMYVLYII